MTIELNPEIKFITLTNDGYINYTLNCLKSLENIGFEGTLKCYAIGKAATKTLTDKGYDAEILESTSNGDNQFRIYRKPGWNAIMKRKFDIIHKHLLTHQFVCFTDGDIVFCKKDFLDFCRKEIGEADLLIQNDTMVDGLKKNLCAGFMFIKSTETTRRIFEPNEATRNIGPAWDDQKYVNWNKNKMKIKLLPLALFPNGRYYYKNCQRIDPKMIHFNWVQGHVKMGKMKRHKKWFLK